MKIERRIGVNFLFLEDKTKILNLKEKHILILKIFREKNTVYEVSRDVSFSKAFSLKKTTAWYRFGSHTDILTQEQRKKIMKQ